MAEHSPLETILRLCAAAAPVPWYPKPAAAKLGMPESDLLAFVDQLRDGGLVARTDPAPGLGRGIVLTPAGMHALTDPGALEWLRRNEVPPLRTPAADAAAGERAPEPERERAVRMSLLAPFTPWVVRGLMAANIAVFAWGVYLGHQRQMKLTDFLYGTPHDIAHATGAVGTEDVLTPGWGLLRLLTNCFVHFGLIHIGFNMLSLQFIGPVLERMWGHVRFLVLYLVAGFGGSCAAMVLRPMEHGAPVLLAGASGAVWGLMSALAVWVILNRRYLPRRLFSTWGRQILFAFAINVVLTYYMSGQISAEGHYGGGIVGAVCAVLLQLTRTGSAVVRGLAAAAVAALPVFGLWAVTHPERFNPQWDAVAKDVRTRMELREMQDQLMPEVKRMEGEAVKLVPGAAQDPVINRNPGRRDEEQVRKAVAAYGEAEVLLRPAADLLRGAGPFADEDVERARQARLELVEARLDLYALNRRCLEAGARWPADDEKKRQEAIDRVRKSQREWDKLLR
jgi:rhomboid protease GluP